MSLESDVAMFMRKFDESAEPLAEHEIASALTALRPTDRRDWVAPHDYMAEYTAFSFHEREPDGDDDERPCFMPMTAGVGEDGTRWEWPSVHEITQEMLAYWARRATIARHLVLKARYAGLVWQFNKRVTGSPAPIEMAQLRIDAVVEMAEADRHKHEVDVWVKLDQALGLAMAVKDTSRIAKIRDVIIQYERKVGCDDSLLGLWGHAFDLLCANKGALLTQEQRHEIIADLEDRLQRGCNPTVAPGSFDPRAAEAAAQRLATHYQKENQPDDVRRVLLKFGGALDHMMQKAGLMAEVGWLEDLERLYRRFHLKAEASQIRRKIRELGPASSAKLVHHEHTMEIKKGDMNEFVDNVLAGDLEQSIRRFVVTFIPRRKQTEAQLTELATTAPLMFLLKQKIVDDNGRPIACLGSLDEDMDGHVVFLTARNISFRAMWVRCTIEAMIERHGVNTEWVIGWIAQCPVFDETKREIIRRGLDAYFATDAMTAIHLLVPQVEDAVRTLIELLGGDVFKPNRKGGMDYRTLDDLLRDQIVTSTLDGDIAEYLRVLYTDCRGINLRNRVCHGMVSADHLEIGIADRVFHTIMLLSLVRRVKNEGTVTNS